MEPTLAGLLSVGILELTGVEIRPSGGRCESELQRLTAAIRADADTPMAELDGIQEVRRLYRAIGLDPTRTRPSSEALIRRLRQGKELYRVNCAVDAVNLASIANRLPYGLYDRARLEPPITIRLGAAGEGYAGIRKDRVNVEGRFCIADRQGAFGNPTSDSERTSVRDDTRELLLVQFAPAALGAEEAGRRLGVAADLLAELVGGVEERRELLA